MVAFSRARGRLTSVQQETKAELVINLETAKALGLEVPPDAARLADKVTRVAASTIWHTAIAWACATHSRTVPPSEFSVRPSDVPLDIGAVSVQKKGRLVSLTASGRGSAR